MIKIYIRRSWIHLKNMCIYCSTEKSLELHNFSICFCRQLIAFSYSFKPNNYFKLNSSYISIHNISQKWHLSIRNVYCPMSIVFRSGRNERESCLIERWNRQALSEFWSNSYILKNIDNFCLLTRTPPPPSKKDNLR